MNEQMQKEIIESTIGEDYGKTKCSYSVELQKINSKTGACKILSKYIGNDSEIDLNFNIYNRLTMYFPDKDDVSLKSIYSIVNDYAVEKEKNDLEEDSDELIVFMIILVPKFYKGKYYIMATNPFFTDASLKDFNIPFGKIGINMLYEQFNISLMENTGFINITEIEKTELFKQKISDDYDEESEE